MRLRTTFRKDSFEEFVTDTRLVQLCDVQRTGDEFLDVIRLFENQHSDILAWMLDPREGHGQGEEILRDLLIQASVIASQRNSSLDRKSATALFFKKMATVQNSNDRIRFRVYGKRTGDDTSGKS